MWKLLIKYRFAISALSFVTLFVVMVSEVKGPRTLEMLEASLSGMMPFEELYMTAFCAKDR